MGIEANMAGKKRASNLSLREHFVTQARGQTDNFSGVVESLPPDYVQEVEQERLARDQSLLATILIWNDFDARNGAFADEHSTL